MDEATVMAAAEDSPRRRYGRAPRVPNEKLRILRVYVYESELAKIREAAGLNIQSMSDFAFLAISEAAEECGAGPIPTANARQADRRRRNADDQPVELERRKVHRRKTD